MISRRDWAILSTVATCVFALMMATMKFPPIFRGIVTVVGMALLTTVTYTLWKMYLSEKRVIDARVQELTNQARLEREIRDQTLREQMIRDMQAPWEQCFHCHAPQLPEDQSTGRLSLVGWVCGRCDRRLHAEEVLRKAGQVPEPSAKPAGPLVVRVSRYKTLGQGGLDLDDDD